MHIENMCMALFASLPPIKEKIQHYEQIADYFSLAKAYLADQEIEKSFEAFIIALEKVPKLTAPKMSDQEKILFDEGMQMYLKEGMKNYVLLGRQLIEKFEKTALDHPEYYHLQLLMAVAYANVAENGEQFVRFFESFYRVYPSLYDHFLSHKTLAVLHLRLMQIAKDEVKRNLEQKKGVEFLTLALEKKVKDPALFKMLVLQSVEKQGAQKQDIEKKEKSALLSYLEKMVDWQVAVARTDIVFYVNAALTCERSDLAEKILAIAKKEYNYSRSIQEAEEYLEKWKGKP